MLPLAMGRNRNPCTIEAIDQLGIRCKMPADLTADKAAATRQPQWQQHLIGEVLADHRLGIEMPLQFIAGAIGRPEYALEGAAS